MHPRSYCLVILSTVAWGFLILLGGEAAGGPSSAATVSVLASPSALLPSEVAEIEILVEIDVPLGAYSVTIDCDASRFSIENVRGGTSSEFAGGPFSNVQGCNARLSGFQVSSLDSPVGLVSVARLDLRVAPDAMPVAASLIELSATSLNTTDGSIVDAVAVDTAVSVGPVCGDGVLDDDEACDDGDDQWSPGQWCNAQCSVLMCGDPDDSGRVTATDALFTLRAAVGLDECASCVCDVDDSGGPITASDALATLRLSTGAGDSPTCPICS